MATKKLGLWIERRLFRYYLYCRQLNAIGLNAEKYWREIPNYFLYARLGEFIVMPNHIHGIIIIDKSSAHPDSGTSPEKKIPVEARLIAPLLQPPTKNVIGTTRAPGGFAGNKNPMLHENLSRIIRWYKGRTTFETRKFQSDFNWQANYYDHIIRNRKCYEAISTYILENPLNWDKDDFRKK